jgi:uncharacterized membrane protein YfcA
LTPLELVAAAGAGALGAVVQGSVGLGLSLVTVPLLVLIDPSFVPGPVLCVAIVLTLLLSHRERRSIDFHGVAWVLAGRIPGTVLGAAALVMLAGDVLSVLFGVLVLGGPPVALLLQNLPGARLRGTLSGIFLVGASVSLLALVAVSRFGRQELVLALVLLPGVLLGFGISGFTAPILDRGYTRPTVLVVASVAALVAIGRQVL